MKDCDTQYRIMDTALELIWQSSYDSVSVSDICKKAKVNKGSFYHFFESKEVLAAEALNYKWNEYQGVLDQVFSAQKEPIERLADYADLVLSMQAEMKDKVGYVCGCPTTNMGLEQSPQSKIIAANIQKCFDKKIKYFEVAIKDANDSGEISVKDVRAKANELQTYCLGALTRARIDNDLKHLSSLKETFKLLLGIKGKVAAIR